VVVVVVVVVVVSVIGVRVVGGVGVEQRPQGPAVEGQPALLRAGQLQALRSAARIDL
jgi:hypothetical protein